MKVDDSMVTTSIMEPPVSTGGIAASSSSVATSAPMPVGPSILWLERTMASTPVAFSARKSSGRWAADWQVSRTTSAPTCWARGTMRSSGLIAPVTLEAWVRASTRVRSVMTSSVPVSIRPSSVRSSQRRVAPVRAHSSCQGTRLAWCSARVTTTSSPSPMMRRRAGSSAAAAPPPREAGRPRLACPMARATRLMASVAFLVKTSSLPRAPTKAATASRASSKVAVASSASW